MQGYEVRFNVYAETSEEADAASSAIGRFVNELAARGIAVTAGKLTSAVSRWKNNPFVINYFSKEAQ